MKRAVALSAGLLVLTISAWASQAAAGSIVFDQVQALCIANHASPDAVFKAAAEAGWGDPQTKFESGAGSDPFLPSKEFLTHQWREAVRPSRAGAQCAHHET